MLRRRLYPDDGVAQELGQLVVVGARVLVARCAPPRRRRGRRRGCTRAGRPRRRRGRWPGGASSWIPAPPPVPLNVPCGRRAPAISPRSTDGRIMYSPTIAVGGAAHLGDHLVEARLCSAAADGAHRLDEGVEAAQPIEVVVDVVEQEGVQHLADQEGRARERHRLLGNVGVPAGGLRRRPITSTLSAPRRSAGDSGVFWRRPPSQKKRSPTAMAGNRIGSAAEASACSGPIVTDWARTKGSLLHLGGLTAARSGRTPPTCPSRCRWRSPTATPDGPRGCWGRCAATG